MSRVQRYAFPAAIVLVAVYVVLRSLDLRPELLNLWIIGVCAAALLSPLTGLTVLAALGPFTEALTSGGDITAVPYLIVAVGLSVLFRVVASRRVPQLSLPVVLAFGLLVGTALGVGVSLFTYGADAGRSAAELWVPGIGGGLTVLLCAWWVGTHAEVRPLVVAAMSSTLAAGVALLDYAMPGSVQATALDWMIRPGNTLRLEGVIPAANPAAMIFLTGFAVMLSFAVFQPKNAVRLTSLVLSVVSLSAVVLTYSRSGILATALVVGVVAWRRWGLRGLSVAVGAGAVAIIGAFVAGAIRSIPIEADTDRIDAWAAAIRMWLAHPSTGAGFRSFEWLHADYGSGYLDAPHNESLRIFAEEGTFFGLVGVAFAATTVWALLKRPDAVATAGACVTLALIVVALFNNPLLYAQVNVPVFVVIGCALGGLARTAQQDHSFQATQDLRTWPGTQ